VRSNKDGKGAAMPSTSHEETVPNEARNLNRRKSVYQLPSWNIRYYSSHNYDDGRPQVVSKCQAPNWQSKNESEDIEKADLFVSEIRVDGGSMLKRLRPAPQGRAHRIRKRSNHVTVILGSNNIEA
jgi:hypothetical protein